MIRYKFKVLFILAVASGMFLAFFYVNPYSGEIFLSEFILQLSGSRGEFPLGDSLAELLSFSMRMIPSYIFEMYFGISFFQVFCTASVYVFSRYPRRMRWYFGEMFHMLLMAFLFQLLSMTMAAVVTMLRYRLLIDREGLWLAVNHFLIHSLWMYAVTVAVNLLALWVGSSASFSVCVGVQNVCIALLGIRKYTAPVLKLFRLNPIEYLILGWQTDYIFSCLWCFLFCVIAVWAGAVIVKHYELLTFDSETGV